MYMYMLYEHIIVCAEVKINIGEGVKFAQDICNGMTYLHSLEPLIARFDLNPHHVFVSHSSHGDCIMLHHFSLTLYIYVAVPRQDSMSPARTNAVLSGYCNRFVGYP